jgi:glycosidase
MKRLLYVALFSFLAQFSIAQAIVTLNPPFANGSSSVTITYNADEGNGQLSNLPVGTVVYAHMGITVNGQNWQYVVGNWGTVDNRTAMTRIGNTDQYTLSLNPSIREWFQANNNASQQIPGNATISKLCLVFRNATGSLEGKTSTNGDIFVDLSTSAFAAAITSHPQTSLLVNNNQTIQFTGQSSAPSILEFTIDGASVANQTNSTVLNYTVNTSSLSGGLHTLILSANNGAGIVLDTLYVTKYAGTNIASLPANVQEGITYTDENTAYLQLRAPYKEFIYVLGDFNNWTYRPEHLMNKTPDGQYFWVNISNLDPNREYRFQYHIDWEGLRVTDPYCTKILDPWNDPWISEDKYPNLIDYPNGITEGIVGVLQTRPEAYQWDNSYTYTKPPKEDLVVYELLVRDFTEERTFASVIEKLPYLDDLGINAIELMPVAEFDGNESWGYAPNFCSAVDKYYGPANELKRLVDSCHARGIAVLSDVVFNHAWGQSPLTKMYFNPDAGQYGEPTTQNPWLNPQARHAFNVGYDFNHESQATKYFTKKTLKYWIEEFKIDGFRFDLSKGFTQTFTGSDVGAWGNYDQSRVNILQDYAASIRETDPTSLIIFEHFGATNEEIVYANNGIMLWAYGGNQYNEATMGWLSGNSQNLYLTTPQNRGWNNYGLLSFMESHDEERMMFRNKTYGNSASGHNTREINTALARMGAAASFYLPLPGPRMIWQFGERGYDLSIFDCLNGTSGEDCKTGAKPPRWEDFENPQRRALYEVYRKLNYLKTTQPSLRNLGHFMDVGGYEKVVRFTAPELNVVIVGNFDVVGQEMNPGFPFGGVWYDYLSDDSLDVSNPGNAFNYAPGEYHVYIDRRIVPPGTTYVQEPSALFEVINGSAIVAFPNPMLEQVTIRSAEVLRAKDRITVSDLSGRIVWESNGNGSNEITFSSNKLESGVYLYTVSTGNALHSGKLIKP